MCHSEYAMIENTKIGSTKNPVGKLIVSVIAPLPGFTILGGLGGDCVR